MHKIGGVAVATITPFGPGGERIDYGFIEGHLEFLQREGAQGVIPTGTNGEFPSLTLAEKKRIIEVSAAARGDMFLIVGCGSCSLPEVLELTGFARDAGADAALIAPPFYFRDVDTAGIIEFYRRVLESADLPVLLYNIPAFTGIDITDEIIDALLGHRNLAGIKDTGGDMSRTAELIGRYPQLKVFGGSDSMVGVSIGQGAAGVISGAANVFPGLVRDVWDARGRGEDVSVAGSRVRDLRLVIKKYPWIAATKYALALRGFPETFVRPPNLDLNEKQKKGLKGDLRVLGLL